MRGLCACILEQEAMIRGWEDSYRSTMSATNGKTVPVTTTAARKTEDRVILCCLGLGLFSTAAQFSICTTGVMVVFLFYGYVQELIFRLDGFRAYGFYLTLIQFSLCSVFAFVERKMRRQSGRTAPLRTHVLLSVLTVGTVGFSNASLGYLNYPTQVIFKCCKLIPVLVGGVLIQAAVLMSFGLAAFILTDSKVSPSFSVTGVVLIATALLFDAVVGNVQEKAMAIYHTPNSEIMLFSYSIGALLLAVLLAGTQQLLPAVRFCAQHPWETYGYGSVFALLGYLGVQMVLTLISISDAFVTVVITTCRKAVSIILSFMLFAKPFAFQYVWSGAMVMLGVFLHAHSKKLAKRQRQLPLTTKEAQRL
ncbi:adenosine 3'-phospho 5'-phosphosulfate transporter 2 isoform X2 [Haemaphysalis longicornis]